MIWLRAPSAWSYILCTLFSIVVLGEWMFYAPDQFDFLLVYKAVPQVTFKHWVNSYLHVCGPILVACQAWRPTLFNFF